MLEVIKEAATNMAQTVFTDELEEEVVYLLDNCKDDYDKGEMNELIKKLLSAIEETISTFGG